MAASEEGIKIVDGLSEGLQPCIDHKQVSLNGDPDHETFRIARVYDGRPHGEPDGLEFEFCKTAQKPYDVVVTAALIALKARFGDGVRVSSDGDYTDWEPGIVLADKVLGTGDRWLFDPNNNLQAIP